MGTAGMWMAAVGTAGFSWWMELGESASYSWSCQCPGGKMRGGFCGAPQVGSPFCPGKTEVWLRPLLTIYPCSSSLWIQFPLQQENHLEECIPLTILLHKRFNEPFVNKNDKPWIIGTEIKPLILQARGTSRSGCFKLMFKGCADEDLNRGGDSEQGCLGTSHGQPGGLLVEAPVVSLSWEVFITLFPHTD